MPIFNENLAGFSTDHVFVEISRRIALHKQDKPEKAAALINCGVGDVALPLPAVCLEALRKAIAEMADQKTMRGYAPETGYEFLRKAITKEYQSKGMSVAADEVFISDGIKSDCVNLLDLFDTSCRILIPDPAYPAYADACKIAGFRGLDFFRSEFDSDFVAMPPATPADIIYLCFPDNPTGVMATFAQLAAWVDYARSHDAVILFDGAYEAFIRTPDTPRSIYEIPGADECAIEMRSFSKSAGFTGLRCGYSVVPEKVMGRTPNGERRPLRSMWMRRQNAKFNGVAYPVQRAAEATYTHEGQAQIHELTSSYLANARLLSATLASLGWNYLGGIDSPYLWVKTGQGRTSWDMFDFLLEESGLIVTPGIGFGSGGEGFFRLSAFNNQTNVETACQRLLAL